MLRSKEISSCKDYIVTFEKSTRRCEPNIFLFGVAINTCWIATPPSEARNDEIEGRAFIRKIILLR